MKNILLILSVFSFSLTYAQRGGGQGGGAMGGQNRGGGQQQQRQERPKFNASKIAGVFNYDIDQAINKIKIKKKNKALITGVGSEISKYNTAINEIALLNKENFDTLNVYMNDVMKSLQVSGDRSKMKAIRGSVREKLQPVRLSVMQEETKLNESLTMLLDENQLRRWKQHQKEIKAELSPGRANNQMRGNNTGNRQRGGGQGMQGGAGGGRRQ
jgi:hypothetical protein